MSLRKVNVFADEKILDNLKRQGQLEKILQDVKRKQATVIDNKLFNAMKKEKDSISQMIGNQMSSALMGGGDMASLGLKRAGTLALPNSSLKN